MKNDSLNRKDFFKKVSLFGIGALGATTLLKACGGGEETPDPAMDAADAPTDDPCSDLSGLSEAEIQGRESLNYVAETPNPDERCDNCALWIEPEDGSPCGGCSIMAGPIHPAGWCSAWVAG
jgi:hypothetical protein